MRTSIQRLAIPSIVAAFFASVSVLAIDVDKVPPENWVIPSARPGVRTTLVDATSPRAFIGLTPCRIVDTRGNGAPIQGGPFSPNQIRSWQLVGKCGLPFGSDAVSLNVTVTGTGAHPFGFLTAWPTGTTEPTASNINWSAAGQTIANAVIVPLGTGGSIDVQSGNAGTDVVVDINGYFSAIPGTPLDYFSLNNNSTFLTMQLTNFSSGCTTTCGLLTQVLSGYAIEGDALASNVTYGVYGFASSAAVDSSGIFGVSIAQTNGGNAHAGVRGESSTGYGVIGMTAGSGVAGVRGDLVNGAGTILTSGVLGTGSAGVVFAGGLFGSGTKSFVEPHPTDPGKMIRYVSLEGPEAGTYFRGTARTVAGRAIVQVPETFRTVTDSEGLTIQLTPTGPRFAQMSVESSDLDQIVVLSNRDVTFHYLVQGVRRAYRDVEVVTDNTLFAPDSPSAHIPLYLSPVEKQRLIDNGTYNPDGSVNMKTADAMGWTRAWSDRAEADRKASEAAAAARRK